MIEIDGKDHFTEEGKARDRRRDAYMREQVFEILRVEGYRVTQDPMSVRREIEAAVTQQRAGFDADAPRPAPPPKRGEGSQFEEVKSARFHDWSFHSQPRRICRNAEGERRHGNC